MTDLTIHNLQYFLKELEKDINFLEDLSEQEYSAIRRIHVLHGTMSKICQIRLIGLNIRNRLVNKVIRAFFGEII